MRPEKGEAEARKREAETEANFFCEAEAKTHEAEATVSNESCNILLSYCISYIIKIDISQTELT